MDPFAPTPVKLMYHRIFLPVRVNGVTTVGILDTGASVSLITPELAAAAKVRPLAGDLSLMGISGSFVARPAIVDALTVGSSRSLEPRLAHVYSFGGSNKTLVGAQVGLDWLAGLDYDIDFAHEKMRPYRTGNCLVIDPPWRNTSTGLEIRRGVLASRGLGDQLSIPVAFQGSVIDATFDTGTTQSILSHDAALDAGLRSGELRNDPVQDTSGLNRRSRTLYVHKFGDLAIGEEELHDFPILVMQHFDRRDDAMILGMDYIDKRHFWLSLTTNALYIDSGEPKKPVPPFDHAHWIAGAQIPAYPQEANGQAGEVTARCAVEASGDLTGCKIVDDGGHTLLGDVTLKWLTGALPPIMQPAYRGQTAVREIHDWHVVFGKDRTVQLVGS